MGTLGVSPPVIPGYAAGRLLGAGGSGRVWAATRERDGLAVAVKVLPVDDSEAAEAAARELAVLARIDVEGLVGFHEAVTLPGSPAQLALVLDRVRGGALTRAVSARGHLSVGESVTVLTPVCRTLAGLHSHGVVHGDVAPGNVLLELSGRPLLADLGIARIPGEHRVVARGTPGFMPPEVVAGDQPTAASDVYAVGALAWWCVTGEVPGPPGLRSELADLVPDLPEAWCEATVAALAGDPTARPDAAELALAYFESAPSEPLPLVVGVDETSLLTRRVRRAAEQNATEADRDTAARRRRVPRVGRRTVGAVAAVLVGLCGAGVGVRTGFVPGLVAARTTQRPVAVASSSTPLGPVRAQPAQRGRDPVTDRLAPARDPRAVMQSLSDLRATAMARNDAALLGRLDAPGSPALRQDAALLAEAGAAHRTYRHVDLHIVRARTVDADGAHATIDAVVDTAPYHVVSRSRTTWHPAVAAQSLRFVLSWSGGRWRVHSVARAG